MTGREWKVGEVGVNLRHGYRGIFVAHCAVHGRETCWHNESGHADPGSEERRPLAAIDPEDREQVQRLQSLYNAATGDHQIGWGPLQVALREFANPTPPKPDQPTGLGAVVEDADGHGWVNVNAPTPMWQRRDDRNAWTTWDKIAVVRVLHEGWSE